MYVTISLILFGAVARMWSLRRSNAERLAFQDSRATRVLLADSIRVTCGANAIVYLTTITFLKLHFVLANVIFKLFSTQSKRQKVVTKVGVVIDASKDKVRGGTLGYEKLPSSLLSGTVRACIISTLWWLLLHHREHLAHLEWHHIWHGWVLAGCSSLPIGLWLTLVHHHRLLEELLLEHGDLLLLEHHDLLVDNLLLLRSHLSHLRVLSEIHRLRLSHHHSGSARLHTHKGSHLRNLLLSSLGVGLLLGSCIWCRLGVLGRFSHLFAS